MANFCRYCGNPVRPGANFCPACGKSLAKASAQPGNRQAEAPKRQQPSYAAPQTRSETMRSSATQAQPRTASARVEDGKIILGIFGYFAEINIMENIAALCDLLYEGMFSCLDALWTATKTALDTESIPDRDERVLKSITEIGNQLGHQMEKINGFKWQYTEYKKKTEYGSETII